MAIQISDPKNALNDKENAYPIGIDFGTTNCVVSYVDKGKAKALPIENGQALVPSLVCYLEGETTVGQAATTSNGKRIPSIKRLLGDGEKLPDSFTPLNFVEQVFNGVRFKIEDRFISPLQVARDIFLYLKEKSEIFLKVLLSQAVVTVPAYFSQESRHLVRLAAEMAGIRVLRLVSEPTAAALSYGLEQKKEGHFIVYDLGGGTFDVSVLRLVKGFFQVLSTGGDTNLGGDDIDTLIVEDINKQVKQAGEEISSSFAGEIHKASQKLKEDVSVNEKGVLDVPLKSGTKYSYKLNSVQLHRIIEPLIKRTFHIMEVTLNEAGLSHKELTDVILVGGSTRLNLIRQSLNSFFNKEPLCDINPDEVVALGAAMQADALINGSDTLLQDITPLSLGIETMGGIVEVLIPRNSPLPSSVSQTFTTYQDNQKSLSIHIVQGEREMVRDCRSLGKFIFKDLPPLPAGVPRIEIRFTLDVDGLLVVSAIEQTTGTIQTLEIHPSHGLTDQEIKSMIKESMRNAQGDVKERLKQGEIVILRRMKPMLDAVISSPSELLNPEKISQLKKLAQRLASNLETKNHEDLVALREDIEKAMHSVSGAASEEK